MGAAVGNEKLELRRQKLLEDLHDLLGRHRRAGREQRQAVAHSGAVVGQHQNGDPAAVSRGRCDLRSEALPRRALGVILGRALPQRRSTVLLDRVPDLRRHGRDGCCRCEICWPAGMLLVPQVPPQRIFSLALLTNGAAFDAQPIRLLAQEALECGGLGRYHCGGWRWAGSMRS